MKFDLEQLEKQACYLLRKSCTDYGIVASPEDEENYRRIWSRDSMIAGIAGLLCRDERVIEGFRNSIRTLAMHQHEFGMIPSNVQPLPDEDSPEISYGTLAGRVDATSWFAVGSCLFLHHRADDRLKEELRPHLQRAFDILDRWEFNGRGLLYTPPGGNWADEYPVGGYTLYDNMLRQRALALFGRLYRDKKRTMQAEHLLEQLKINFWPDGGFEGHPAVYHPSSFTEAARQPISHFACSFGPGGYNFQFDAAGNGLALLAGLASAEQLARMEEHLERIFDKIGTQLVPAFWPPIMPDDPSWHSLKNYYNYNFKNHPHHYHNGGIWPVWMGWLALGLCRQTGSGRELAEKLLEAWMEVENPEKPDFSEYIASDTLEAGGKKRMCYSGSGLIFLSAAIKGQGKALFPEES